MFFQNVHKFVATIDKIHKLGAVHSYGTFFIDAAVADLEGVLNDPLFQVILRWSVALRKWEWLSKKIGSSGSALAVQPIACGLYEIN